jgi:predicted ester cyclase
MKKLLLATTVALSVAACNNAADKSTAGSDTTTTTTTSGADSEEAREERNKEIVLESLKAFEDKKVEEVLKNVSPDAVEYMDGSMPPVKGRDTIMKGMKEWMAAISDLKQDSVEAFADGDKVAVYSVMSGKWTGDYMGMKATGRSFRVRDVDIFTFNKDGQITEHRSVQSGATLANQIGMKMPNQ